MKTKIFLLTVSLLLFTLNNVYSKTGHDTKKALKIEKRVNKIKEHLIRCTVIFDDLSGCTISRGIGTGVIVSEDGYILTAGYVARGGNLEAKLYDGKYYAAQLVCAHIWPDYALYKIDRKEKCEYAELGSSSELAKDEACLMLGFPNARLRKNRPPMIRIGFVQGISPDTSGFLQASCIMTRGDFGGPLFDLDGKLIGINCQSLHTYTENYFAPVDRIKKNWNNLINADWDKLNKNNEKFKSGHNYDFYARYLVNQAPIMQKPFVLKGGKKSLTKIIGNATEKTGKAVVKLKSNIENKEFDVYGTIVNNKGYIVSKSSRVGNNILSCELYDGKKMKAEIIGRDETNDLVLIKIKADELSPVDLSIKEVIESGKILGAIGMKGEVISSGILGVGTIASPQEKPKPTNLGGNPPKEIDFEEVSSRRSNFPAVFAFDIPLLLHEYGAPVVTIGGKIIGISIAHEDRAGSLAIPIAKVKEVVEAIIAKAKSGKNKTGNTGKTVSVAKAKENTGSNCAVKTGTVKDIDGNTYKTVKIGDQWWMAENLKTTKYNDGTEIPLITDNNEWADLKTPGYCWYDNDESYKEIYGALYNEYTVITKKLCPEGWHIPSLGELETLRMYLGDKHSGEKLREAGTVHWKVSNRIANNESGFTALPAGSRRSDNGAFFGEGEYTYLWTSNRRVPTLINYYYGPFRGYYESSCGFSVRCVKD